MTFFSCSGKKRLSFLRTVFAWFPLVPAAQIERDHAIRIALSGVPQELGQCSQVDLRGLFLAPRNLLRLRFHPPEFHARKNRPGPSQHLALLRSAPSARRLPAESARWIHAADHPSSSGSRAGRKQFICKEPRRLPADFELQRPHPRALAGQHSPTPCPNYY